MEPNNYQFSATGYDDFGHFTMKHGIIKGKGSIEGKQTNQKSETTFGFRNFWRGRPEHAINDWGGEGGEEVTKVFVLQKTVL